VGGLCDNRLRVHGSWKGTVNSEEGIERYLATLAKKQFSQAILLLLSY
jgi:hypothetical protein